MKDQCRLAEQRSSEYVSNKTKIKQSSKDQYSGGHDNSDHTLSRA